MTVVPFPSTSTFETIVDIPECGELAIERAGDGWQVHHMSWWGDHAAIIAYGLPDRLSAVRAALMYALKHAKERKA